MELSINIFRLAEKYGNTLAAQMSSKAGFSACDYALNTLEKEDNPFRSENYREVAENIRREIEEGGIVITQTHAPFRFSAKTWDTPSFFEEKVIPTIGRAIEITALLGATVAVVHPIHHPEYKGHEEDMFVRNMDFYRRLIPYAKEYGVKIAIENMWQLDKLRGCCSLDTCGTTHEFIRYIDTLDSEYIVACLDVGHVGLPNTNETVADFIYALGHDRLKALHIHDNDYKSDAHLLPYMGKLNWADITRALGEINYDGDFTYEVKNYLYANICDELAQVSVDFMGAVGKELVRQIEVNRQKKL